jgi:hypothetical protein
VKHFGPGSGLVLSETVRELTKKGQKKILLNLADVTYVDSSGVGQLSRRTKPLRSSPYAEVREQLRNSSSSLLPDSGAKNLPPSLGRRD